MIDLSIITPVYNGSPTIERCLNSVIEQNCPQVEHILIDGGSKDDTVCVVQHYAQKHHHIRWLSEIDRGQSEALNKGIALARGPILGILNADDTYQSGVLNRVLAIFNTLPSPALLVGNCNIWDSEGRLSQVNRPDRLRLKELLLGPHVFPLPFNPSAYFYHAALHRMIGYYNVDEHYVLDWDFLLRAVQVAEVRYVDETWGNFYMLEGSKTVNDLRSGDSFVRQERILRHYRKDLSFFDRQVVSYLYWYHNSFLSTLRYFQTRPDEISWRTKARVQRIIGLYK